MPDSNIHKIVHCQGVDHRILPKIGAEVDPFILERESVRKPQPSSPSDTRSVTHCSSSPIGESGMGP